MAQGRTGNIAARDRRFFSDFLHDMGMGEMRDRRLPGSKDICNEQFIGCVKDVAILAQAIFCAGIAMRLKDSDQTAGTDSLPYPLQGR